MAATTTSTPHRAIRQPPTEQNLVGIEWLFPICVAVLVDIILGFSLTGALFSLFVPTKSTILLSVVFDAAFLFSFIFALKKNVNFALFYDEWIKSSVRDRGDIVKLNETISQHDFERSFDGQRYSSGEKSSLFLHETCLNSTIRNRSKNTTISDSSFLKNSSFFSDDKDLVPMSALISPKSQFSKPIFTEGQFNSMSFDRDAGEARSIDDDMDSRRFDWIFRSTDLSLSSNSFGYQVGFILKDQKTEDDEKMRSENEDVFSSGITAELSVGDLTDSIFAQRQRRESSPKKGDSSKMESLYKKVAEWNKRTEEAAKQKKSLNLSEDFFKQATIHQVRFNDSASADLSHFSANLRTFISKEILRSVLRAIDETNEILAKSHAKFWVGVSAVDVLVMAMEQKPDLCSSTKLPFLLPFLAAHPNQTLLLERMREFAQNPFPKSEKLSDLNTSKNLDISKDHGDTKTDTISEAEFIFNIFSAYLDQRLTADPFAKSPKRPFSSAYVLREQEKPTAAHLMSKSFYIYARNKKITSFDFVTNGGFDIYVSPSGPENVFAAFMLLFIYCKQYNNGYLGEMRIDQAGMDLLRLLRSH